MQRFGVLYSKFEIAVQDAIKTPQAKARLSRDTFAMNSIDDDSGLGDC